MNKPKLCECQLEKLENAYWKHVEECSVMDCVAEGNQILVQKCTCLPKPRAKVGDIVLADRNHPKELQVTLYYWTTIDGISGYIYNAEYYGSDLEFSDRGIIKNLTTNVSYE